MTDTKWQNFCFCYLVSFCHLVSTFPPGNRVQTPDVIFSQRLFDIDIRQYESKMSKINDNLHIKKRGLEC